MTHPALTTRFTELVGIRHPIVQTGMGWVATPQLAAATSAGGGLGILAAATMTYDELAAAIADVRSRTDAPFGVNMRADQPDVADRIELLLRAIHQRRRWRAQYDRARSATDDQGQPVPPPREAA